MKHLKIILFISLFSSSVVNAQNSKIVKENTSQTPAKTKINDKKVVVQLTPFGYISLAKGYWAFMDTDFMDAWSGSIETLNGDFKIRFSDGLIVSVFDDNAKKIKWKKELKTDDYSINYAVTDDGKTKHILAKIKTANFSAQVQNDSEIDKFLEIISQYRIGRCESCFDSHNTKRLRIFFEKPSKND